MATALSIKACWHRHEQCQAYNLSIYFFYYIDLSRVWDGCVIQLAYFATRKVTKKSELSGFIKIEWSVISTIDKPRPQMNLRVYESRHSIFSKARDGMI